MNRQKCSIWVGDYNPGMSDLLNCGIKRADARGFEILGSPIGESLFMQDAVNSRIDKVERTLVEKLPLLQDPQSELSLSRSALFMCKLVYTLRKCNPL